MRLFIFINALFFSGLLLAQQPGTGSARKDSVYLADSAIQLHELKEHTSFYTDTSNQLTIKELSSSAYSNRFQPLRAMVQPAQPYISHWLRISITVTGEIENWWLLLNDSPSYNAFNADNSYVDAWLLNDQNQVISHQRTGLFVPRSQKTIRENPGLNRLSFSSGAGETNTIYIRVYNEYDPALIAFPQLRNPVIGVPVSPSSIPLAILSCAAFVFSIISFFFFIFVREKAYLFFGFYTLTLSQHYLLLHPNLPFVDWYIPEHPQLAPPFFTLLTMGGFILFSLFGRYFINLPQLSKRLDKIFRVVFTVWVFILVIIVILMAVNRSHLLFKVSYIFILSFIIFLIRIAFFNTILVRFYVAGALWLISFTILGLLWGKGVLALPFNPWPVGQLGQLLIYAAGLAYKVRLNEKARTQAELIRLRNVELAGLYAESKKQKEEIEVQKTSAEQALSELKATQSQLIQSEKMASLGELTAGIAHEIQNPLNFVNNFSELNKELLVELKDEIKKGNIGEINVIADNVISNEEKINQHGKRADAIVKGMLLHSRSSSGKKEPTDINALCDEYLRLAYHGLRAKDKSFNATMKTNFDESIGNINVIPQDIGRVILNLITNAFYAATERLALSEAEVSRSAAPLSAEGGFSDPDYKHNPTVWVSTKKVSNSVLISVRDNGPGIPQKILDKIFQPFFTTKPTGQGTGLGLSLSYDIVKVHGGEIKVHTKDGKGLTGEETGTEFIIQLPI